MTQPPPRKPQTPAQQRAERLAKALRANLARRKDQARARRSLDEEREDGETDTPSGKE